MQWRDLTLLYCIEVLCLKMERLKVDLQIASVANGPMAEEIEELKKELSKHETALEDPDDMSRLSKPQLLDFVSHHDASEDGRKTLLETIQCYQKLRKLWEEEIAYEKKMYLEGIYQSDDIDEEKVMSGIDEAKSGSITENPKMTKDIARYIVNNYRRNIMNDFNPSLLASL